MESTPYRVDESGNVFGPSGRKLKKKLASSGYAYVRLGGQIRYVTDLVQEYFYPQLEEGLCIRHIDYKCRACDALGSHEIVTGNTTRVLAPLEPSIKRTFSGKYSVWLGSSYLGTYADYDFAIMVGDDPSMALKRDYNERFELPRERKIYRPRGRKMKRRKKHD